MIRTSNIFKIFFALSFWTVHHTQAAEDPAIKIKLNGRIFQRTVSPRDTKEVFFYAETSGNISTPFNVVLSAPKGTKLEASMATIRDTAVKELRRKRDFWNLSLMTPKEFDKFESAPCLTYVPNSDPEPIDIDRPVSDSPLCNIFSEDEMNAIAEALAGIYGGSWSRGQVCGYLMKYYFGGAEDCNANDPVCEGLKNSGALPTPSPATLGASVSKNAYISRYGLARKNTCAPKQTRYLLRFKVDLSKLDPEKVPDVTLMIQAMQYRYGGEMAATLKPVSDGMYAPQPILLMAFLGSFCGQRLNVIKWASGRPSTEMPVKIGDLIQLYGHFFIRSPIGGALQGGKGTFELHNGRSAYGVCFNLVKERQSANGYDSLRFGS